jgi:hypothetical protein
LLEDRLALVRLGLTSRARLAAENLFLRKQLALYQERRKKPRRPDPATRLALVVFSRWLDWRALLIVVQPETLIAGIVRAGDCSGGGNPGPAGRRFRLTCNS